MNGKYSITLLFFGSNTRHALCPDPWHLYLIEILWKNPETPKQVVSLTILSISEMHDHIQQSNKKAYFVQSAGIAVWLSGNNFL